MPFVASSQTRLVEQNGRTDGQASLQAGTGRHFAHSSSWEFIKSTSMQLGKAYMHLYYRKVAYIIYA